MVRKTVLVVTMFVFLFSSHLHAQNFSLGLKASTLGFGVEAEGNVKELIGGRIGANYLSFDYSGKASDIDYDFEVESKNLLVLLDVHPFRGSFRISGGVVLNDSTFDATSVSADKVTIGDKEYSGSEIGTLKGTVDFNKTSPYIGLGWDTSFGKSKRFGFLFDIGVVYQGSPDITLSADGPISTDPTFQSDLAREEQDLQDDLDKFKYYPVIALGVSYRF